MKSTMKKFLFQLFSTCGSNMPNLTCRLFPTKMLVLISVWIGGGGGGGNLCTFLIASSQMCCCVTLWHDSCLKWNKMTLTASENKLCPATRTFLLPTGLMKWKQEILGRRQGWERYGIIKFGRASDWGAVFVSLSALHLQAKYAVPVNANSSDFKWIL